MLLWAYSFLTYNLYNEYWDEYEFPGSHGVSRQIVFVMRFPPPISWDSVKQEQWILCHLWLLGVQLVPDLQLALTCFEFVFSVVGMVNASIHTYFIYLFLTSLSHN